MKLLAIIGNPIEQVRSPAVFADYCRIHNIAAVMVPLKVSQANFAQVLKGLRLVENFAGAVMDPDMTSLLLQAEKSGCRIVKGLEMLHGQVEALVAFLKLNEAPRRPPT